MDFKTEFVQNIKKIYQNNIEKKKLRDRVEMFIVNYFTTLKEEIAEEIEISGGEISILNYDGEVLYVHFQDTKLCILFEGNDFEVLKTDVFDEDEKEEIDRLYIDNGVFKSRKYGINLNEELLGEYLKVAFDEELRLMLK